MTDFNGVKRRTRGSYPVLYRKPRQIVTSLEQGDLISFRYAVRLAALQTAREKKLRRGK